MKTLFLALIISLFLTNAIALSGLTHPVFAQTSTSGEPARDNGGNHQTLSIAGGLLLIGLIIAAIFDDDTAAPITDPDPLTITPPSTVSF